MSKTHWTAYWETGVMTSLPMDFKENYDGEIADFWGRILANYQQPIKVLDVCTGNGAVAILLQELAEAAGKDVAITAVDASDINPTNIAKVFPNKKQTIDKIKFIGGCLIEQMTAQISGPFDLVVSQYGIEYCDTQSAAKSINEVLKPDGQLVFIAHAPDTDIHHYMRQEEQVYQYLDHIDLLNLFLQYGSQKLSANGFKSKLGQAVSLMQQKIEWRGQALFNTWFNAANQLAQMNNATLKSQQAQVQHFYQQHLNARLRAKDMLSVSDKLVAQPDWYKVFEGGSLKLVEDGDILYKGHHNAGHYYRFSSEK